MPVNISLDDAGAARAWFADVVEPLADSFDPEQVERYVSLFTRVLEAVDPEYRAAELAARYERVRRVRPFAGPDPEHVFVLSRVTLGADAAISSVMLDAVKQRFAAARVWYVGSRKGYELFAADRRVEHAPAPYNRTGSVRDRVVASQSLENLVNRARSIVVDPDSRMTQLGLVPVCPEEQYFFLETRGTTESGSLPEIAARWASAVFGVAEARPYVAVPEAEGPGAEITVSFGVGENPAKRVPDPFERRLLEYLASTGRTVMVDRGAGGEEGERVEQAAAGLANVSLFEGAFAEFAAHITRSRLYVGYDSAGQHAAAASGVPLVAIFAGYPNRRFLERWRPTGPGPVRVVEAQGKSADEVLRETAGVVALEIG